MFCIPPFVLFDTVFIDFRSSFTISPWQYSQRLPKSWEWKKKKFLSIFWNSAKMFSVALNPKSLFHSGQDMISSHWVKFSFIWKPFYWNVPGFLKTLIVLDFIHSSCIKTSCFIKEFYFLFNFSVMNFFSDEKLCLELKENSRY